MRTGAPRPMTFFPIFMCFTAISSGLFMDLENVRMPAVSEKRGVTVVIGDAQIIEYFDQRLRRIDLAVGRRAPTVVRTFTGLLATALRRIRVDESERERIHSRRFLLTELVYEFASVEDDGLLVVDDAAV